MSSNGRYRTQTPDLLDEIKDLRDRLSKLERTAQLPYSAIDGQKISVINSNIQAKRSSDTTSILGAVNFTGDDNNGPSISVVRSKEVPTLVPNSPGATSVAFFTIEGPGDFKNPTFTFYDKNNDVLIADSTNARQGFSDPKLAVPWFNPNTLTSSVSGTFATFARTTWYTYHPHLRVTVFTTNPATTTSEITVVDTNGPSTLGTITGPANTSAFTDIIIKRSSVFGAPTSNGNGVPIDVQIRRASGAGTCQALVHDMVGIDLSDFSDW